MSRVGDFSCEADSMIDYEQMVKNAELDPDENVETYYVLDARSKGR